MTKLSPVVRSQTKKHSYPFRPQDSIATLSKTALPISLKNMSIGIFATVVKFNVSGRN